MPFLGGTRVELLRGEGWTEKLKRFSVRKDSQGERISKTSGPLHRRGGGIQRICTMSKGGVCLQNETQLRRRNRAKATSRGEQFIH